MPASQWCRHGAVNGCVPARRLRSMFAAEQMASSGGIPKSRTAVLPERRSMTPSTRASPSGVAAPSRVKIVNWSPVLGPDGACRRPWRPPWPDVVGIGRLRRGYARSLPRPVQGPTIISNRRGDELQWWKELDGYCDLPQAGPTDSAFCRPAISMRHDMLVPPYPPSTTVSRPSCCSCHHEHTQG